MPVPAVTLDPLVELQDIYTVLLLIAASLWVLGNL